MSEYHGTLCGGASEGKTSSRLLSGRSLARFMAETRQVIGRMTVIPARVLVQYAIERAIARNVRPGES